MQVALNAFESWKRVDAKVEMFKAGIIQTKFVFDL